MMTKMPPHLATASLISFKEAIQNNKRGREGRLQRANKQVGRPNGKGKDRKNREHLEKIQKKGPFTVQSICSCLQAEGRTQGIRRY